jgi:hypothetical protein
MQPSIILDPASARAFLDGRKTQLRVVEGHGMGKLVTGTCIYGREACAPGRLEKGHEILTDLSRAQFVAFADGWRRDRDGQGWQAKPPHDPNEMWISAIHMPAWACRIVLELLDISTENLQHIDAGALCSEGVEPLLGGLFWRGPKPMPGLFRSARRAFAAHWDITHPVLGLRWADNPVVHVLTVRLAA